LIGQALDVIKQAKMAQILGPEGGGVLTPQEKRRSLPAQASRDRSRRGSRESLDSCQYDVGDEVSILLNFFCRSHFICLQILLGTIS
jgi:hypothetical protein